MGATPPNPHSPAAGQFSNVLTRHWRMEVWCKERACGDIYARINIMDGRNGPVIGWTNETAYGGIGQKVILTFQSSTSAVMTIEGEPEFKVWVFDYVNPEWTEIFPYYYRLTFMNFEMVDYNFDLPFELNFLGGDVVSNMKELEDYGAAEQLPKLEGKRMMVIMSPKKSGSSAAKKKAE
jgi:hypothetical protein